MNRIFKASAATLLLFLTGSTHAMSKTATKFDWLATESAPQHYPMKIIQGTFFYHNGGDNGLYIPSGGTYTKGWGEFISTHVGGDDLKELPDRMSIVFYSLAERQFYKGTFNLPYEKILTLFREGVAANKKRPIYRRIMVGTAPGGVVAVWLTGSQTKEVFFGQAEKLDLSYGRAIGVRFDSPADEAEFTAGLLADILKADEIAAIKKDGIPFGTWARYRKLYRWDITTAGDIPVESGLVPVNFLNGEYHKRSFPFAKEVANTPSPLPREIGLGVIFNNWAISYVIHFDEFELMDAFEKLGVNGELVHIEFWPGPTRETTKLRVYNDKESIALTKARVADI